VQRKSDGCEWRGEEKESVCVRREGEKKKKKTSARRCGVSE
jgi:hypothetical protein